MQRFSVEVASIQAEEAAAAYTHRGINNWLRRTTRLRKVVRDLNLEILLLQIGIAKTQDQNNKFLEILRSQNSSLIIEKQLTEQAELNYSKELGTYAEVLKVLESQHTQTVQRISAFAVSLLGVIVGALLTAALRR
ncbi:hypothetical protein [Streptomyces asiaticus]